MKNINVKKPIKSRKYDRFDSGLLNGKGIETELKKVVSFTKKAKLTEVTRGSISVTKLSKDIYIFNIAIIIQKDETIR